MVVVVVVVQSQCSNRLAHHHRNGSNQQQQHCWCRFQHTHSKHKHTNRQSSLSPGANDVTQSMTQLWRENEKTYAVKRMRREKGIESKSECKDAKEKKRENGAKVARVDGRMRIGEDTPNQIIKQCEHTLISRESVSIVINQNEVHWTK